MVFYRDNQNRARRVEQLINDCSSFEKLVIDEADRMEQRSRSIIPTLTRIMKENGLETWTQLRDRVSALLPPDLRTQYELLAENAVDARNKVDLMFMIVSCIAITRGAGAVGADFARFIVMGSVTIALRSAATGLRLVLLGQVGPATRYFTRAGNLCSVVRVGGLVNPRFLRILHIVQTAGRVVGWIAFGLDAFLLVLAAFQGPRQKTELQKATRDLFGRRLQLQLLQMQAAVASSFYGRAETHLRLPETTRATLEGLVEEDVILDAIENALTRSSNEIGHEIDTLQNENSFESAEKRLREQDNGRHSWTDEDPAFAEAMQRIEKETYSLTPRL